MSKVIIAEKPSVAKNIAEALKSNIRKDGYLEGNGYYITWAFGHLLQLYDAKDYDEKMAKWKMDNFPFIPKAFKYKVKNDSKKKDKPDAGAKKQLKIIEELINRNDVDMVISACDYDREGQIIGDIITGYLKVKKPVYRLLQNEWTADEVIKGMEKIKPNTEMKSLRDAGISRQWADWTIGINLTSVATLKYQRGKGNPLNIGRVLLPTLKIIYDRDKEIANFVPDNYFKLNATFKTSDNIEYEGAYIEKEQEKEQEKFKEREKLDEISKKMKGCTGVIVDKQTEKKKEYPPYLFNLSNLQGYITSKYKGWTSDKVLKVAQGLYEKKYITYPRTASVVLEESLADRAAKVLNTLKKSLPFQEEVKFIKNKRIFDNSKVESHSAIIPTYLEPKTLSGDEEKVYSAIKNRFIAQFMPIAESEETKIFTRIKNFDLDGIFISKGKVQIVEGWKKVEKIESKDTILPFVNINDEVDTIKTKVSAHSTKPPKRHTEKTLLKVMETCGKKFDEEQSDQMMDAILSGFSIGTPATRAETIKKLKDIGYIYTEGKNLICSELGVKLVETFPIQELFDLEYTGRLEKTLADMEKGKVEKEDFLKLIFDFTTNAINQIKGDKENVINQYEGELVKGESLGKCPCCGNDVIEGKIGFGCSNWRSGCKYVVWKEDKFLMSMGKKITKDMVMSLLADGKVAIKGLKSRKGNIFDASLSYEKNKDNDYFSWKMEFLNSQESKNRT